MWLFNIISINNLLLFVLLLVMFLYFLVRGEKNREMFSLMMFIFMVLVWQLALLFQNVLFHPLSAYPIFYFLNSGFTPLGYLGLVMFSYYYVQAGIRARSARHVFPDAGPDFRAHAVRPGH